MNWPTSDGWYWARRRRSPVGEAPRPECVFYAVVGGVPAVWRAAGNQPFLVEEFDWLGPVPQTTDVDAAAGYPAGLTIGASGQGSGVVILCSSCRRPLQSPYDIALLPERPGEPLQFAHSGRCRDLMEEGERLRMWSGWLYVSVVLTEVATRFAAGRRPDLEAALPPGFPAASTIACGAIPVPGVYTPAQAEEEVP